jgi:hypothetical protein
VSPVGRPVHAVLGGLCRLGWRRSVSRFGTSLGVGDVSVGARSPGEVRGNPWCRSGRAVDDFETWTQRECRGVDGCVWLEVVECSGDLAGCVVDLSAAVRVLGVIVIEGPVGGVAVADSVVPIAP